MCNPRKQGKNKFISLKVYKYSWSKNQECECKTETETITPDNVEGPLTQDFQTWLSEHEYYEDLAGFGSRNSFGGRKFKNQPINKRPVIFIHGNSDGALTEPGGEWNMGWSNSISYFMKKGGYTTAELYAITYGRRDITKSYFFNYKLKLECDCKCRINIMPDNVEEPLTHITKNQISKTEITQDKVKGPLTSDFQTWLFEQITCRTATRLRRFVNAVLAYTGAEEIDIIAHSMGVTYARIIIQGDMPILHNCKLGNPLNNKIKNFIAIAGANYGLCGCSDREGETRMPACDKKFGFWSGINNCRPISLFISSYKADQCGEEFFKYHECKGTYGELLKHLNEPSKPKDAKFIAVFWSSNDTIIGKYNLVWGHKTSLIPGTDEIYEDERLTHYTLKTATVEKQLKIIKK
uniref:Lipase domain-containing protein n=1 Tax=Meloidogyne hapla TaxID=6305 RepID=A0A1I8B9M5_MELHA